MRRLSTPLRNFKPNETFSDPDNPAEMVNPIPSSGTQYTDRNQLQINSNILKCCEIGTQHERRTT